MAPPSGADARPNIHPDTGSAGPDPERRPDILPPDGAVADAVRAIENVRRYRTRTPRDVSIRGLVEATQANAEKVQRRAGSLVDLWTTLVPSELVVRTEIVGLRGSILHVRADSSAVAFDLDRRLRSGLLAAMRERSAAPLTRVRVTVGAPVT